MTQRLAHIVALLAAVTLSACAQQEGDVCQRYGTAGQSDCAATLECCGEARTCSGIRQRGICVPDGTCPETTPLVCDGDDAGASDAGPSVDAGELADAGELVDAGADAGSDAGLDSGTDSGPGDAGPDVSDAGPDVSDAGPDVSDAAIDASVPPLDSGAASDAG